MKAIMKDFQMVKSSGKQIDNTNIKRMPQPDKFKKSTIYFGAIKFL